MSLSQQAPIYLLPTRLFLPFILQPETLYTLTPFGKPPVSGHFSKGLFINLTHLSFFFIVHILVKFSSVWQNLGFRHIVPLLSALSKKGKYREDGQISLLLFWRIKKRRLFLLDMQLHCLLTWGKNPQALFHNSFRLLLNDTFRLDFMIAFL